ncbi:hypothetical protein ACFRJ9_13650 [Paenarthrobacter sp. NPDC056912]|uniref:hypothetical protein n=1 Tax=Paenarthrobacter sp. NPDC056912 TaxID=3345965 RepID=UPI00366EA279
MLMAMETASLPWWLMILVAVIPTTIALVGTILATRSQRRSSREANQIGERNAAAAQKSSIAATESVRVAEHAAKQAAEAAAQLNSFRLHDDTIKTLYWAADHAILPDSAHALLGLEVLGALMVQVEDDSDYRGGRLVKATREAVTVVAMPTFISVLTNAARDDDSGGGTMRVAAVELNAAKLLLAHYVNLEPELREELEMIASASLGSMVNVKVLHAARHLDQQIERVRAQEMSRRMGHDHGLGISL